MGRLSLVEADYVGYVHLGGQLCVSCIVDGCCCDIELFW